MSLYALLNTNDGGRIVGVIARTAYLSQEFQANHLPDREATDDEVGLIQSHISILNGQEGITRLTGRDPGVYFTRRRARAAAALSNELKWGYSSRVVQLTGTGRDVRPVLSWKVEWAAGEGETFGVLDTGIKTRSAARAKRDAYVAQDKLSLSASVRAYRYRVVPVYA